MAYDKQAQISDKMPKFLYLKSIMVSMLFALMIFLVLALVVTFTSVSEGTIPLVTSVVTVLAIAFSGMMSANKKKKNGLVHGLITGAIYVALIFFLSWVFISDFSFDKFTLIKGSIGIVSGAVGGMIGVNLK